MMTDVWWDGKNVMGKAKVLDTPSGQVLQSLDTVKQQLNTSYQQDLKNEQSTFNWFIS